MKGPRMPRIATARMRVSAASTPRKTRARKSRLRQSSSTRRRWIIAALSTFQTRNSSPGMRPKVGRRLVGRARAVNRLERGSRLAAADDQPGDADRHQQVADADQGGVAADARNGEDVADEPEALRVLERDVQRVEPALQGGQHGGIWVDVARDRH